MALAILVALALLAGMTGRPSSPGKKVASTTPPMPITGPTTVQYSLRVVVTQAMNAVSEAGRFAPTLDDLAIAGATMRLDEDADSDGYDDDGRIELTRDTVTLCLTLPSETGVRYMVIVDGSCS